MAKDDKIRILNTTLTWGLVVILALVVAYFRLNRPTLAQWDEAVYAMMAKKIMATKDLLAVNDYWPYDKPQVWFWMTALLYKIIGVNEVAVRAVSATCLGVVIMMTAGWVAKIIKNPAWGLVSAVLLAMCPYLIFIGRHGQMDLPLTLGIGLSLFGVYWGIDRPKYFLVFGLGLMIAMFSKQVISIVFVGVILIAWLSWSRNWSKVMNRYFIGSLLGALCVPLLVWYIPMYCRYGGEFLSTHFIYHVFRRGTEAIEGNSGTWWYYGLHLVGENKALFGLYFAGAIYGLIAAFNSRHRYNDIFRLTSLWIWLILIIISLSQTKLESYIVPIMPAVVINTVLLIKQSQTEKMAFWFIASGVVVTTVYLLRHSWWMAAAIVIILLVYISIRNRGRRRLILATMIICLVSYNLPYWSKQWLWQLRPEDKEAYQYTQHLSTLSAGNEHNIVIDFYK